MQKTQREVTKTSKEHTVKLGDITLQVKKETSPYVPSLLPYDNKNLLELLAFAEHSNIPTLLVGETGVGKTAAVRHLYARLNKSLRRVNVNGSMTAEDFIGQLLVNEKGTYWKDGVLVECMRNGYGIVIDEINAASPEVLFALHSLLDDDRYIVLTDHPEREIVRAHPEFRVYATMNPPERYAGTQAINKALLSRFGLTVTVPIPPPSVEYTTISGAQKTLTKEDYGAFKSFVAELRSAYTREELDIFVSPRDTAHIVRLHGFFGNIKTAIEHTIVARGTTAEKEAIQKLMTLHFGAKTPKEQAEPSQTKKTAEKTGFEVGAKVQMLASSKWPQVTYNPRGVAGIITQVDTDNTCEVAWSNGRTNNSYVPNVDIELI